LLSRREVGLSLALLRRSAAVAFVFGEADLDDETVGRLLEP
jgi:hypothetical protein